MGQFLIAKKWYSNIRKNLGEVNMSVIVAVRKGDTAVIGCDTLTCFGPTKESAEYIKNHSKIIKVGDNYIAVVGHTSNALVLSSYFTKIEKTPLLDSVQNIFETARKLHKYLKEEYFLNPTDDEDDPYESSQMRYLIANPSGIFGLYDLRSVQEYTKFYAFGSGYRVALGAMRAIYDKSKSAEEIARAGLEAAVDFDDGCALPVEIETVMLRSNI